MLGWGAAIGYVAGCGVGVCSFHLVQHTVQLALATSVGCCPTVVTSGHLPFLASTKCVIRELRSGDDCTAEFSYFQRIAYSEQCILLGSPDFLITKTFISEFPRLNQL